MGKVAKFLLASTAFAPVLLTYACVSLLNKNYYHALLFLFLCVFLLFLCDELLHFARNKLEPLSYKTSTVETSDHEVFGLLLVYILPLVIRDLSAYNWLAWVLISIFFCLITAVGYGYHFNPLLNCVGYHFYKVTEKGRIPHILVTKRRVYNTGETLSVVSLGDYFLLERP